MQGISLKEKLALFSDTWSPHIIADFNDCYVKLAKLEGDFTFHRHDDGDELFFVVEGSFTMAFRDREELVPTGSLIVVPAGVEHCPKVSDGVCSVIVMSRKASDHTGGVDDPRRKDSFPRI